MKERIVSLDIAKGICIVLVALGHYQPENAPQWYVTMYSVMHTFRMPLFLFASGYIYIATRKEIGYGSFLLKKIKRLFVPYLATSAIVITFKLLTQGHAYVEHPVTVVSYVQMFYLPVAGYLVSIGVRAASSFCLARALPSPLLLAHLVNPHMGGVFTC